MSAWQIALARWAIKWIGGILGDALHRKWEADIKAADEKAAK